MPSSAETAVVSAPEISTRTIDGIRMVLTSTLVLKYCITDDILLGQETHAFPGGGIMNLIGRTLLFGMPALLIHAGVLTSNLLTNPGAESGLTGWTVSGGTGAGVDNGT